MGCVEDYRVSEDAYYHQRAHVGGEVVVAEGEAALGQNDASSSGALRFCDYCFHIPRGQELALLDVDRASGFCGCFDEVCLAREQRGDLDHIDDFRGGRGFFRVGGVGRALPAAPARFLGGASPGFLSARAAVTVLPGAACPFSVNTFTLSCSLP